MKRAKHILPIIIILSFFLITACGSKETDAASTAPTEESTQPADIIMESQQTRQELAESIATANSLLSSVSENEAATESSESSSQYVGDAPASYKPRGQMVTQKYRSYSKHYVTTVTPTLDSVTTKEPAAVITSNPASD